MAKMTIEEVEALFTPEIMERLVTRIMDMLDLKAHPNKHTETKPEMGYVETAGGGFLGVKPSQNTSQHVGLASFCTSCNKQVYSNIPHICDLSTKP